MGNVKKYIEGSIKLESPSINVKKMLGDEIEILNYGNIHTESQSDSGVYLESLYSKMCHIRSDVHNHKSIIVNRNHGHISISVENIKFLSEEDDEEEKND